MLKLRWQLWSWTQQDNFPLFTSIDFPSHIESSGCTYLESPQKDWGWWCMGKQPKKNWSSALDHEDDFFYTLVIVTLDCNSRRENVHRSLLWIGIQTDWQMEWMVEYSKFIKCLKQVTEHSKTIQRQNICCLKLCLNSYGIIRWILHRWILYLPIYESNLSQPTFLKAWRVILKFWKKKFFKEVWLNQKNTEQVSKNSHDVIWSKALCCNFHAELLASTLETRLLDPIL